MPATLPHLRADGVHAAPVARTLGAGDAGLLREVLDVFAEAFEQDPDHRHHQPDDPYLERLLAGEGFFAIAGLVGGSVVGGLTGYVLNKPEQARCEFYLYDLCVRAAFRRQGVATAMIEALQALAAKRDASGLYVQADPEDEAAVALYTKLGTRHEVLHFDLPVRRAGDG